MGRAKMEDLSPELQQNLRILHERINIIRAEYGKPMVVSSGYRRQSDNDKTANAAKMSNHLKCAAVDIRDTDGKFWAWCIKNIETFEELDLYLEDKRWTPTWVHIQIFPPKSGKRVFIPSAKPPIAPDIWDGKY